MRDTVFFDINETTLDLAPLRAPFAATFGSDIALAEWFGRLLQTSTVCAITGVKTTFRELARAGLDRSAALFGVRLEDEARDALLAGFADLPPHPDVRPALLRLKEAGLRPVAFSNSSVELLETQLHHADLGSLFDRVVSVEEVGSFKPDPAVYQHALARLDRAPAEAWMVAAHDWDVHGAMQVGLHGAYVARGPTPYHPAFARPTVTGPSLDVVVDHILDAT